MQSVIHVSLTPWMIATALVVVVLAPYASYASTTPYEDLLDHRSGFGAHATGGAGGEVVIITDLNDGSFRAALMSEGPKWIRFAVSGSITFTTYTFIKSDKTIDGRGADITITGPNGCPEWWFWGDQDLATDDISNLIIHNITFDNIGEGDNCGIGVDFSFGAHDIWVDHCTFTNLGDESVATGHGGGSNVTLSWNRFVDTPKGTLIGWSPNQPEDSLTTITGHHNFYSNVSRIPKVRRAKVHFYNNYMRDWGWSCSEISMFGQYRSENNIYERGSRTAAAIWAGYHDEAEIGYARSTGDVFLNGATVGGPGMTAGEVFIPADFYSYSLAPPDEALRQLILTNAGRQDEPQWPGGTVPTETRSWGSIKALYR